MDKDLYNSINNSYKKTLVFHLGVDAGFFSEYCNMLYAVSYCLRHKIKFVLYSKDANWGIGKGWQDYFQPFFHEVHDDFHQTMNYRFPEKRITTNFRHTLGSIKRSLCHGDFGLFRPYYLFNDSRQVRVIKKKYHFDYFTQDIWHDFDHHLRTNEKIITTLRTEISSLSLYNIIDNAIWRYTSFVQEKLNKRLDSYKKLLMGG